MTMAVICDELDVTVSVKIEEEILKFFDVCRDYVPEGKLTETLYKLRKI